MPVLSSLYYSNMCMGLPLQLKFKLHISWDNVLCFFMPSTLLDMCVHAKLLDTVPDKYWVSEERF